MVLGVSVIICCYNSAERLPETLKHLANQQVAAEIPWEVIVVDNASTDDTAEVAKQEWAEYKVAADFYVLDERQPGKTFAFDKGVAQANYEYIIICDDDNWLFADYVERAFKAMQANLKIGALGGCGIFEPEQPVNVDILPYEISYVNGPQTWAATDHWVYGAGSIYRRSLFIRLKDMGWQQITTGRIGNKLISGEDVEICFAIYLLGYDIIANDELKFKHFVPKKRQNIQYISNLKYWQGYTNVLLMSYFFILNEDSRSLNKVLNSWLFGITKSVAYQFVKAFVNNLSMQKKTDIEKAFAVRLNTGAFNALIKQRYQVVNHHNHLLGLLRSATITQ
ncbi:glycosyltransferase [Mucilaginibacter sp.]|uniref:glycosyltransferase n=1 Tax=Mucilaginibacter sp. TaxID=1882438 RepID=UPI003264E1DB